MVGCGGAPLTDRLEHYEGGGACGGTAANNSISEQMTAAAVDDTSATWAYVLEEGEEAIFTRAWLSENSTQSIDIQYFIFAMDNVGIIALDYLIRAADRGVQVRMLIDDFMLDVEEEDVAALNAHPIISIRVYNPNVGENTFQKVRGVVSDFKGFNQRMHNKTFVVDGQIAITGGRNIADEYFDYDQAYNFRDRDVLLIGAGAEAIANSFTKPADGEAEVRLFNLSPDTKTASMSVDGKEIATDVAFTLGSDWFAMDSSTHKYSVTESGSSKVVATFSQTPPIGASSVFLIGAQAATAPGFKTTTVFLVDNPSL